MEEQDPRIQTLADYLGVEYKDAQEAVYAGRYQDEMAQLDEQMGYAEGLRSTAGPEGRAAGRVYVAANPLEHLSAVLDRRRGGKEVGRLNDERTAAMDKRDQASTAIALAEMNARQNALRGSNAAPVQGPPQPSPQAAPQPMPPQAGAPAPQAQPPAAPMPQGRPVPQINPTVGALRGGQAGPMPPQGPPQPQGPMPPQGPPEPGWFDKSPARGAIRERLGGVADFLRSARDFEGLKSNPFASPAGSMGARPLPNKPYPWPKR